MSKFRPGMISDIYFDLGPIALIVADLLAIRADRKYPSQFLDLRGGMLKLDKQFPALDGIPDRAAQHAAGHLAFDNVVLGAFLNGLNGNCIVIVSGQDDDRDLGRLGICLFKGFDAGRCVRQAEIQKDNIKADTVHYFQPISQPADMHQTVGDTRGTGQISPDEHCVIRIVFDEQRGDCLCFHQIISFP
jgi:hypothetical protein